MPVTPGSTNALATIQLRENGGSYGTVTLGKPSGPLMLALGSNTIDIRVTEQDTVTTKTYTLAVMRRTPYQDWAFGLGLSGVGLDAAGNFDADGLTNIQEWTFATIPDPGVGGSIQVNSGVLIAHGTPSVLEVSDGLGGVSLFALFGRRKDADTVGITYAVEFSETLTAWNVSSATPTVIAQDSEIEAVVIPFPQFATLSQRIFFRVKITGQ
jgi:hypothetical protein